MRRVEEPVAASRTVNDEDEREDQLEKPRRAKSAYVQAGP